VGTKGRPVSIALAAYPQYMKNATDYAAEREIGVLQDVVTSARTVRTELKLDPKEQVAGALYSRGDALAAVRNHLEAIQKLAGVKLELRFESAPKNAPAMSSTAEFDLVLEVPAAQAATQRQRLEKEREQLQRNVANSRRQLADDIFLSRAPAHVVENIRHKLAEYEAQLDKIGPTLGGAAE